MFHPPGWIREAKAGNDGDLGSLMTDESGSDSWLNGRMEFASEAVFLVFLYPKRHTYIVIGDRKGKFQDSSGAVERLRKAIVIRIKERRHVTLPSCPQRPGPAFCITMQPTKAKSQWTLLHDTVPIMLFPTFGDNEPVGWWRWERMGRYRKSCVLML